MGVAAAVGPSSSENSTHVAKNGPFLALKSRRFELDFHLPEHENGLLPEDKLHQGPPGTWYEGTDGSCSGHLPFFERKWYSGGQKWAVSGLEIEAL